MTRMDEYIKREMALKAIDEYFHTTNPDGDEQIGVLKSRRIIRTLPSAYVAPVRHGRWSKNYRSGTTVSEGWVSSCCDMWNERKTRYCPNCGADMRGTNDE